MSEATGKAILEELKSISHHLLIYDSSSYVSTIEDEVREMKGLLEEIKKALEKRK